MSKSIPAKASDRVQTFFRRLCDERSFRLTSSSYSAELFGNLQIVASNDVYEIDYRLDRGDESLYVVVDGREYLVTDAMLLLKGYRPDNLSIETEEHWLLANSARLNKSLSDERARCIEVFEKRRIERLHRMFPGAISES